MNTPFVTVEETPSVARKGRTQRVLEAMSQVATLSEALRILGASIMVGSMSLFLMQGWVEGNDVSRYFTLLAQTVLLAVGGFGLSYLLKENKGARLFFGLSLVSVTANFTILGALIYSVFQLDNGLGQYPAFATWQLGSLSQTLLVLAIALAILVPVTWLGFKILARRSASWLTPTYLLANTLLLIPVRESMWAMAVCFVAIAASSVALSRNANGDPTLTLLEGRFAKLVLFVPALIVFCRSSYLYDLDSFSFTIISTGIYLALRAVYLKMPRDGWVASILDCLSLPLVLIAAGSFVEAVDRYLPSTVEIPVFAIACLPMLIDLVERSHGTSRSWVMGLLGSFLICGSVMLNELFHAGFGITLLALCLSGLVVFYGFRAQHATAKWLGIVTFVGVLALDLADIVVVFEFGWLPLAITGTAIIVAASILDRHGAAIKIRWSEFTQSKLVKR